MVEVWNPVPELLPPLDPPAPPNGSVPTPRRYRPPEAAPLARDACESDCKLLNISLGCRATTPEAMDQVVVSALATLFVLAPVKTDVVGAATVRNEGSRG